VKSAVVAGRLQMSSGVVTVGKSSAAKRLAMAATPDDARRLTRNERRLRDKKRNARLYQGQKERRKVKRDAKRHGLKHSDDPVAERANRTPRLGLPKAELILKTPSTYVGRLFTVIDWHRQIGKVYREMRRGQIAPDLGTKLTFVANAGGTMARWIEESAPKGIEVPPDLDRLDDAELQQLEYLLAKAAGSQALERLEQAKPNADWRRDDDE